MYDSNGIFIVKYYKINLFFEFMFDLLILKEVVFFEIFFGMFGVFICFDIFFCNFVVVLMKEKEVNNIVFFIVWMDIFLFFVVI